MVERAIAGKPHFALSLVDVDRPGPSNSVDTLAALRRELGAYAALYFIIGLDSLVDLLAWHTPDRLIKLACGSRSRAALHLK